MGDEENANKKRKRAEQEKQALALAQALGITSDSNNNQENHEKEKEQQEEEARHAEMQDADAEDDRGSNASTTATADDEALGRERARVRRLLEPFAREQLLEILTNAATQFSTVLDEIKAVASVDVTHRKVFVRGLAWETKTEHLKEAFSVFGDVQEGAVIFDKSTGKSRGYGFVTFVDMEAAQRAVDQQTIAIQGRKATCNLAAVRSHEEQHHHNNNNHQHHRGGVASPIGHTVYTSSMPPNPIYTMMGAQPMPPPPVSPAGSMGQQSQHAGPASIAERKLFVRGLPWEATDESLREEFQKYGELDEASVARDRKTGKSKGYGFVTFKHKAAADRALAQPQKFIDGRATTCNLASQGGNSTRGSLQTPVAPVLPAYAMPMQQLGMYGPYSCAPHLPQQPMPAYAQYAAPPVQDPYRHPQPYGPAYYHQTQPPPPPQHAVSRRP